MTKIEFEYDQKFKGRVPYFSFLAKTMFNLILQIWQLLLFLVPDITVETTQQTPFNITLYP